MLYKGNLALSTFVMGLLALSHAIMLASHQLMFFNVSRQMTECTGIR